ncbi:uncharacterized protein LDX57_001117 [Aspergillus melleus]|uniref:uncharacterized protein n=1 Tax=Aspergillus melleus TaxID=138277 RepID=UPI001E8DCFDD|nr:uncharacterized protein LDX57_001117 [Aspergillus melleus]KAH8423359.1 hypothetical protein LDX57_001117 [Aspergillus melleus]
MESIRFVRFRRPANSRTSSRERLANINTMSIRWSKLANVRLIAMTINKRVAEGSLPPEESFFLQQLSELPQLLRVEHL